MKREDLEEKLVALGFLKVRQKIPNHDTWIHKDDDKGQVVYVQRNIVIRESFGKHVLEQAERIKKNLVRKK